MVSLVRVSDEGRSPIGERFLSQAFRYYAGDLVEITVRKIPEAGSRDAWHKYYHGVLCDRYARLRTVNGEYYTKGKAHAFFKNELLGNALASTKALTDFEFHNFVTAVESYCIEAGVQVDLL